MSGLGIEVTVRGDLRADLAAEIQVALNAVATTVRKRTFALRNNIRKAISSAGLGTRLGKTVKAFTTPREPSINSTGTVFSKAIYKRPGGLVDLITVFDEGAVINARGGRFLAIPIGAGRKERIQNVRDPILLPFRGGKSGYVVVSKANRSKVLFILVPQTKIRARGYSIDALYEHAIAGIDEAVVKEMDRAPAA